MNEPSTGPGGVFELQYHVVWCPKYRGRGKLVKQTWVIRDHKPVQAGDA